MKVTFRILYCFPIIKIKIIRKMRYRVRSRSFWISHVFIVLYCEQFIADLSVNGVLCERTLYETIVGSISTMTITSMPVSTTWMPMHNIIVIVICCFNLFSPHPIRFLAFNIFSYWNLHDPQNIRGCSSRDKVPCGNCPHNTLLNATHFYCFKRQENMMAKS